jgi:hypothetical protein
LLELVRKFIMECNVFSGCLYESPTADDGERDWRIDSESGEQFPFDLTVSEIKNMAIEGVPIKLEHAEKGFERGDEVGRVIEVSVHPVSGYTACKFQLHDTIAGPCAVRLVWNSYHPFGSRTSKHIEPFCED